MTALRKVSIWTAVGSAHWPATAMQATLIRFRERAVDDYDDTKVTACPEPSHFYDFDTKGWNVSTGAFEIILATAFANYLDQTRASKFSDYCRSAFGPFLHGTWPDRYDDEPSKHLYFLAMDRDFPRSERAAILEALEQLAADFDNDAIDPRVSWNRARRDVLAKWIHELVALMRQSLAVSPKR